MPTVAKRMQAYVDDVVSGRIVTGRDARAAVDRYLDDLARARRPRATIMWDDEAAELGVLMLESLHLSRGEYAGKPLSLAPWQVFFASQIFGWRRKDGTRRFREVYLSIARGNGKTQFAAALTLVLWALEGESRAEAYCLATSREQAKLLWEECCSLLRVSPEWGELQIDIVSDEARLPDGGTLRSMGSNPKTSDGLIPHVIVVDELHEWRARQRKQWDKLVTAMGKRRAPMFLVLTTAGSDESDLWQEHDDYCTRVARQEIPDDRLLSLIYRLDDADDMTDESTWVKASPGIDQYVAREPLVALATKARVVPSVAQMFERYHANRRVSGESALITHALWAAGRHALPLLSGHVCYAGLDLGSRDDLASLALWFPSDTPNGPHYVRQWSWCPAEGPRDLTQEPWRTWIEQGRLIVTPGNTTDHDAIIAQVRQVCQIYQVRSLGIDPDQSRYLSATLIAAGVSVWEMRQTHANYHQVIQQFLALLEQARVHHGDDPLLAWAALNVRVETDQRGRMRPAKGADYTRKIDPVVALLIAFNEALFWAQRKANQGMEKSAPTIRAVSRPR